MKVTGGRVIPYRLPLQQELRTATGRYVDRQGLWVALTDAAGHTGWGEAAPWPGFGSFLPVASEPRTHAANRHEAVDSDASDEPPEALLHDVLRRLEAQLTTAVAPDGLLVGSDFATLQTIDTWCDAAELAVEARCAIEGALLDLLGQTRGVSIAELLHPSPRPSVACHALVADAAQAEAAVQAGYDALKLKVGAHSPRDELERVKQIRTAVGAMPRLRLDANGAWDITTANHFAAEVAALDIEWLEQPVRSMAELVALRADCPLPIAADEAASSLAAVEQIIAERAADVIVLKPMFVGGLLRARELARRAADAGMQVCITHALGSRIERVGALHLATALATPPTTCGLGTSFADADAAAPARPVLARPVAAGLGVQGNERDHAGAREATPNAGRDGSPIHAAAFLDATPALSTGHSTDVPNPVRSTALADPDRLALLTGGGRYTARELCDAVQHLAAGLAAQGVEPDSRVALWGPVCDRWIITAHAIGWLGAAICPLPAELPPARRLAMLRAVGADYVLPLAMDRPAQPLSVPRLVLEAGATAAPERFWPLDEVRAVVLTSGSTGAPKPITLTTSQLVFSAFGSAVRLGHLASDRWLACLPPHHVGGLSIFYRCAFYGTGVLLHDHFDAARVAAALDAGEATLVSLVPTMLQRVLDARPQQPFPPSLRVVLLGGAPASEELLARCRALQVPVAVSWGMTETASQAATCRPGDISLHPAPLPFARITPTPDGTLAVRGPLATSGAHVSSDVGSVDSAGRVHVDGRADDVIISGGKKVHPGAVAAVLGRHPAVAEVAVLGAADPHWGEQVVAVLAARTGRRCLDDTTLRRWCRNALEAYQAPRRFVWCDALPRTPLGKLDRSALRRLAVGEQTETGQAGDEVVGGIDGGEARQLDEGMHQLAARAQNVVGAAQAVAESHRAPAEPLDVETDDDVIAHQHRPLVVGLGVDQGHAPTAPAGKQLTGVAENGRHQLLEGAVAVLEGVPEKHDAGGIDLVEAGGDTMLKAHDSSSTLGTPDSPADGAPKATQKAPSCNP